MTCGTGKEAISAFQIKHLRSVEMETQWRMMPSSTEVDNGIEGMPVETIRGVCVYLLNCT